MSIWTNLEDFAARLPVPSLSAIVETLRSVFVADPELRRQVAFSVAMIALSAKMAKADGVVTPDEVGAFREIFHVPQEEERNVSRLYNLAQQDVAGFEAYAAQMARLCGSGSPNCLMLEDILDGLGPLIEPAKDRTGREVHTPRELSLTDQERTILETVTTEPCTIDRVVQMTGLETSRVLTTLTVLEMKRLVRRVPGGQVVRCS